jgi:flagellar motility protein MotE (MotC chaperone)
MRIRLIPVLMFALAATLSIRVDSVWSGLDIGIGAKSSAQNAQPASVAEAPDTEVPVAASEPSAGDAIDPAAEQQATAEAVRDDPFEYSDEEIEVLQQLAKRREELELRARQIEEREALVAAAEMRMEQKMGELKALQLMVEDLLTARSEAEEAELKSLVKIYENMKPKDAAQVFEELDMDILLEVVDRMSERKAAPVLALINPTRAKELTLELAERRRMPLPE